MDLADPDGGVEHADDVGDLVCSDCYIVEVKCVPNCTRTSKRVFIVPVNANGL